MKEVFITRRERFCAAHKLAREDWSSQKNEEVFGKCSNPNWHGHNYELWVTVRGLADADTGFVIDYRALSEVIKRLILDPMDHRNINLDVPFMKGKMASTENVAIGIWEQLEPQIKKINGALHCVKLQESENNSVEYYGER